MEREGRGHIQGMGIGEILSYTFVGGVSGSDTASSLGKAGILSGAWLLFLNWVSRAVVYTLSTNFTKE